MPWFKIDDAWWRSRKVRKLGRRTVTVSAQVAGSGVWALAGDWAADNLTDGFVPWEIVEDWDPERDIASRLITVGFWYETEHDGEAGIQFHDWADWQPTKDQVTQRRKADAERRARWRESRRHGDTRGPVTQDKTRESRRDTTCDETRESVLPDPTRPDPSRKNYITAADAPAETKTSADWFDEFWTGWPRKIAKSAARTKYLAAVKKGADPTHINQAAAAQCAAWRAAGKDVQYIPHPATWLNQGRYDDEIENPNQTVLSVVPDLPVSFEDIRARTDLEQLARLLGRTVYAQPQPPSDQTPPAQWRHDRAVELIDAHEAEIRNALERRAG